MHIVVHRAVLLLSLPNNCKRKMTNQKSVSVEMKNVCPVHALSVCPKHYIVVDPVGSHGIVVIHRSNAMKTIFQREKKMNGGRGRVIYHMTTIF